MLNDIQSATISRNCVYGCCPCHVWLMDYFRFWSDDRKCSKWS